MRRFYLVEKIKEASVIGLVIGTVAVKSYQKAITRVRNLCKNSKKKLYVFYIGKVFLEILVSIFIKFLN
jgi:diphthamide biosynthesis protein 2